MWGFLGNLIGGPIVTGMLNAYKAKLTSENTRGSYWE
jgi:formate/nitrite transporter FocA (FNT family)